MSMADGSASAVAMVYSSFSGGMWYCNSPSANKKESSLRQAYLHAKVASHHPWCPSRYATSRPDLTCPAGTGSPPYLKSKHLVRTHTSTSHSVHARTHS